jgi:hypothetical protein
MAVLTERRPTDNAGELIGLAQQQELSWQEKFRASQAVRLCHSDASACALTTLSGAGSNRQGQGARC